jgi:ribonucleotide reductase alpha subunit
MIYTREQVYESTLEYFKNDELATKTWINKYCLKDSNGNLYELNPDDTIRRNAKEFARIESKYPNGLSETDIYELFKDFKYIVPQGGSLSGVGNDFQYTSLSNCFVVGNEYDSYGGLLLTDQEQVQLMKRRGGCTEENTNVFIKDKGLMHIKDVLIGDLILSKNDKTGQVEFNTIIDKFEADVKLEEQVKITYNNGTIIETSINHPIMSIDNNGDYYYDKIIDNLNVDKFGIISHTNQNIYDYDNQLSDIGWFTGMHFGDGTADLKGYDKKTVRFRINGDEENCIKHYGDIVNNLTESNVNYKISSRKDYKVKVWEYNICNKNVNSICEKYLDNQIGSKVYIGKTSSFIKQNNLWMPFISGLIDSDGHINETGSIDISICMKNVIDDICSILSSNGIDFNVTKRTPKRINESIVYRLTIYLRNEIFINEILKNLHNLNKQSKLTSIINNDNKESHYLFKKDLPITSIEINNIVELTTNYIKNNSVTNNFYNSFKYVNKTKRIGLAFLTSLYNNNIIDLKLYNKINERIKIKQIEYITDIKKRYIDIVVDQNHNYFAGNFGLINIHNCGHDLSHIRPKGSPVLNSALTSTGVVPFMERFSNSTREVAQDGRRGALMLSIHVKSIDCEDFLSAKLDTSKITGANISVKLDDEFMNCLLNNKSYIQRFPIEDNTILSEEFINNLEFNKIIKLENNTLIKKIEPKKIWDKLIHNNWKSAEPGVMFWDTMIRNSTPDKYKDFGFKTVSTNPCVIGDTLVLTNKGWIKIKNLTELYKTTNFKILTTNISNNLTFSDLEWCGITKKQDELYCITFSNGSYLICNDKHKLYDENYNEIIAINSVGIKLYKSCNYKEIVFVETITKLDYKEDVYDLTANPNYNFFSYLGEECWNEDLNIEITETNNITELKFDSSKLNNKRDEIVIYHNFLNSLLSVDCGEIPLCPYDSCRLFVLNLYSYVENPFTKNAKFNFKLFDIHVQYAQRFMDDLIDLEIEKIDKILEKIEKDPEDEFTKLIEKNLWIKIKEKAIQGRRTGLGTTSLGDCIAALNIKFGTDEANKQIKEIYTHKAINEYKSSVIMAKERGVFPIYNSELEKDDDFINFILSLDTELKDLYGQYGRRNISISTNSPTGTISLMTQTTSGIEPCFLPYYKRRRKINPNDKNAKIDFVDQNGDSWEEYSVLHHKFKTFIEIVHPELDVYILTDKQLKELYESSPYYGACANDIDSLKSVEMQGIIQSYISHSISKTCGLPETSTEQDISNLYFDAWKHGCKGFTIYREGSRSGVLISNDKKQETEIQIKVNDAPKRPKELKTDVIRFTNNKEQWIGFVGLLDNHPYEIFTGRFNDFPVPLYVEKGIVSKIKDNGHGSRYDFTYIDKDGFEVIMQGLNRVFDRECWNYAKFLSALLRHGTPQQYIVKIVETLKFENDIELIMTNWKKGVIRILKKYIKEGVESGEKCPECGSKLVYKEGCVGCSQCSYSKCG